jgi:hypothetical protein
MLDGKIVFFRLELQEQKPNNPFQVDVCIYVVMLDNVLDAQNSFGARSSANCKAASDPN